MGESRIALTYQLGQTYSHDEKKAEINIGLCSGFTSKHTITTQMSFTKLKEVYLQNEISQLLLMSIQSPGNYQHYCAMRQKVSSLYKQNTSVLILCGYYVDICSTYHWTTCVGKSRDRSWPYKPDSSFILHQKNYSIGLISVVNNFHRPYLPDQSKEQILQEEPVNRLHRLLMALLLPIVPSTLLLPIQHGQNANECVSLINICIDAIISSIAFIGLITMDHNQAVFISSRFYT